MMFQIVDEGSRDTFLDRKTLFVVIESKFPVYH